MNRNNMIHETHYIDDDITSFHEEDDEKNLYMYKKELVHLEGDKSMIVDNSYDDDHSYSNQHNFVFKDTKKQKQPDNNKLMKFISDSSEFLQVSQQIIQPIPTKIQNNYIYDQSQSNNDNMNPNDFLAINSFEYFILGKAYNPGSISSFNQSGPSFRMSVSKEMESKYKELENANQEVLALLEHWHNFYKEIACLVTSQKTIENVDYFSQGFQDSIIEEIRNMVKITKEKNLLKSMSFSVRPLEQQRESSFIVWGNQKKTPWVYYKIKSNSMCLLTKPKIVEESYEIESNTFELINKSIIVSPKKAKSKPRSYDIGDGINALPPIAYVKKKFELINMGVQTMEVEVEPKIVIETEIVHQFIMENISVNKVFECNIKRRRIKLASKTEVKLQYLSNKTAPSVKVADCQTELSKRDIESMQLCNKDSINQIKILESEKEKLQDNYEERIKTLTEVLNEAKEQNNQLNISLVDPYSNFLPELIPPEQTYKIFIRKHHIYKPLDCVKHFKYEEELYKKFMEDADLKCLKTFVIKMENYIIGTSLPCTRQIIPTHKKVIINY